MMRTAWDVDHPDADNFMHSCTARTSMSNNACANIPE
jgi:hypothetical protein